MQEWLAGAYHFRVLTRDRDLGDLAPYPTVAHGTWQPVGPAWVWYLAAPFWRPWRVRAALADSRPALFYFHSAFDPWLTILPLLMRRIGLLPRSVPTIVAPRGEFSPGARSLKQAKKTAYLALAKILGLYRNVTWQATNRDEATHIRVLWGSGARIVVAPNLPPIRVPGATRRATPKRAGTVRLAFLSRVSRMKNLDGALRILSTMDTPVEFDIYGPREDAAYWSECELLMQNLPPNISATYRGALAPEDVIATLGAYDALLLPTLGENFGHVILESLLAGCPVLVSNRTPWRGLESREAGIDAPLEDPEAFRQAIRKFAAMDEAAHARWVAGARTLGTNYAANPESVTLTRLMIADAIAARN